MSVEPTLPSTEAEFRANLEAVRRRVDAAAMTAGRDPSGVRLLPVSKTVSEERLAAAIAAGCTEFGENKVQEAKRKAGALAHHNVTWSVIGHLQTNKAKDVAEFAHEFQALDSLRLAEALDRRLQQLGRGLDVFIQVNTSGEASKSGLAPDEVDAFVAELPHYSALRPVGLMTLAVFSPDEALVRACFSTLRTIRDRSLQTAPDGVHLGELSMGMSGDFELAISEGATVVRVGQAIFGAR